MQKGSIPVVDQGKELIGGYTENKDTLHESEPPCIVFGDHTRCVKFIDFNFAQGADGVKVLKPTELYTPEFSYRVLQAVSLPDKGYSRHFKFLKDTSFPLPPPNEQKRIANKIAILETKSQKTKQALDAAKPLLDKLRQSILASAFRGDLTAEWRKKNPDVEPASALLDRIRAERRKKWEENELAKMKAKGKEPQNDNWKSKYKEPEPVNTKGLPELPVGWCWAKLNELGQWSGGGTPRKSNPEYWDSGQIPWITPKDMKQITISDSIDKITPKAVKESSANIIPEGSILFVVRSGILRRILPIALNNIESTVNQDLKALALSIPSLNKYLLYNLISTERKIRYKCSKSGTTVESIDFDSLKLFAVPLASQKEGELILSKVETALANVNKIEKTILSNEMFLSILNQSILNKAFQGELVPQDPSDEPAAELLARINGQKPA